MSESRLPQPFRDLEPHLSWSLGTGEERSAKRQASPYSEIKAFYDAMVERMDEVLPYLDQFPPNNVPDDVQRLFLLTLSLAEVAPAVENFGQASVIDGYDVSRFVSMEIFPKPTPR